MSVHPLRSSTDPGTESSPDAAHLLAPHAHSGGDEDPGSGVSLLGSPVRRHIVDMLANLPRVTDPTSGATSGIARPQGRSAKEIATELGLHVTTARFHLDQLVSGGLVSSWFERRESAGRPRKLFGVDGGSFDAVQSRHHYELLSGLLVSSLTPNPDGSTPTPEDVGERWALDHVQTDESHSAPASTAGQWLGRIGEMVDLLHEWGYTPEVSTSSGGRTASVNLQDCPFIELAQANPAVVCGIHRGLIKGAMKGLGETETHVGLTPFVTPHRCVASLTTTAPFGTTSPGKTPSEKEIH